MNMLTYDEWYMYNKDSIDNLFYLLNKTNSYLINNIKYDKFVLFCYKKSSHYKYQYNFK